MDATRAVLRGDLLVRDGRIAALGPAVAGALADRPGGAAGERVEARCCDVLPGSVQGLLPPCQTLLGGPAEQSVRRPWLRERIWPMEAAHPEASIGASARLAACELVAGGTTCINDMGT